MKLRVAFKVVENEINHNLKWELFYRRMGKQSDPRPGYPSDLLLDRDTRALQRISELFRNQIFYKDSTVRKALKRLKKIGVVWRCSLDSKETN